MFKKITTLIALISLAAITACAGSAEDMDVDADAAVDQAEAQIDALQEQIESADLPEEVEAAWQNVDEQIDAALDSMREGVEVDTTALQAQFDQFQSSLDMAEVEADVTDAWNEIRTAIEQLIEA